MTYTSGFRIVLLVLILMVLVIVAGVIVSGNAEGSQEEMEKREKAKAMDIFMPYYSVNRRMKVVDKLYIGYPTATAYLIEVEDRLFLFIHYSSGMVLRPVN